MPDINMGDLTDAVSLPADAQFYVRSELSTPKDKLITKALAFAGYSEDDEAATLSNKTLDSSCVVGEEDDPVPGSFSQVQIGGVDASAFTWIKYERASITIPGIADGALATVTEAVTGAVTTDKVIVTVSEAFLDELTWQARVTAADTVSIRFCNRSGGAYSTADVDFDILVARLTNP